MRDAEAPRRIAGEGTSETQWRGWKWLADRPGVSLDDWVRADQRLVVVAPHPDDEILSCGALLREHSLRGGTCLVVAVTDGEASHPPTAERSAHALAAIRREEQLRGLHELTLDSAQTVRLGLPDGQLERDANWMANELSAVLKPEDVVVTTWMLDGHPDHEACGRVVAALGNALGCRIVQAPVWLWHWSQPGDPAVPWERLRAFDVSSASQLAKLNAMATHVSQLATVAEQAPILGRAIQDRAARQREYFFI